MCEATETRTDSHPDKNLTADTVHTQNEGIWIHVTNISKTRVLFCFSAFDT